MKKGNLIQWVVAVCLVLVTAYTAVHVHHANQKNAIKMAKQAKLDKKAAKREKQLLKKIKRHERKPLSYELSSLTMPYPNVRAKQYHNTKKHPYRLWVEVSLAKQRVYIKSGRYTLYTMNASAAKNYDKGQKEYQKTPLSSIRTEGKLTSTLPGVMELRVGLVLLTGACTASSRYLSIRTAR